MAAKSTDFSTPLEARELKTTICLFDVDGTLSAEEKVREQFIARGSNSQPRDISKRHVRSVLSQTVLVPVSYEYPKQAASPEIHEILRRLRHKCAIGHVSGGPLLVKTYFLQHAAADWHKSGIVYDETHFFRDKTHEGSNDHELYMDGRTIGHVITKPRDTMHLLRQIFDL